MQYKANLILTAPAISLTNIETCFRHLGGDGGRPPAVVRLASRGSASRQDDSGSKEIGDPEVRLSENHVSCSKSEFKGTFIFCVTKIACLEVQGVQRGRG